MAYKIVSCWTNLAGTSRKVYTNDMLFTCKNEINMLLGDSKRGIGPDLCHISEQSPSGVVKWDLSCLKLLKSKTLRNGSETRGCRPVCLPPVTQEIKAARSRAPPTKICRPIQWQLAPDTSQGWIPFSFVLSKVEQRLDSRLIRCLDGSWGTGQTGSSSFEEWIIERKAFSWRLLEHWEFILRVAIHPGTRIEIQWLDQIAAQRGMSFWYWNQLPSYITVECIEDMNVECVNTSSTTTTSGSGSSCSAYCTGGPDDGQCCDKDRHHDHRKLYNLGPGGLLWGHIGHNLLSTSRWPWAYYY